MVPLSFLSSSYSPRLSNFLALPKHSSSLLSPVERLIEELEYNLYENNIDTHSSFINPLSTHCSSSIPFHSIPPLIRSSSHINLIHNQNNKKQIKNHSISSSIPSSSSSIEDTFHVHTSQLKSILNFSHIHRISSAFPINSSVEEVSSSVEESSVEDIFTEHPSSVEEIFTSSVEEHPSSVEDIFTSSVEEQNHSISSSIPSSSSSIEDTFHVHTSHLKTTYFLLRKLLFFLQTFQGFCLIIMFIPIIFHGHRVISEFHLILLHRVTYHSTDCCSIIIHRHAVSPPFPSISPSETQ